MRASLEALLGGRVVVLLAVAGSSMGECFLKQSMVEKQLCEREASGRRRCSWWMDSERRSHEC